MRPFIGGRGDRPVAPTKPCPPGIPADIGANERVGAQHYCAPTFFLSYRPHQQLLAAPRSFGVGDDGDRLQFGEAVG